MKQQISYICITTNKYGKKYMKIKIEQNMHKKHEIIKVIKLCNRAK
jgi:hypothetical protein